jgi:hypothetical protein
MIVAVEHSDVEIQSIIMANQSKEVVLWRS